MIENERGQWLAEVGKRDAEIANLRAELAEAQAAREQTIKNWEADIRAMNALRDTLRTELAEAHAAHATMLRECQTLIAERDTLRQQLAVAREGLGEIKLTDIYARAGREEKALKECGNIARDTLAKMEAQP
jgi:predicted  nucleic acid-binding Zn-ribbon protein